MNDNFISMTVLLIIFHVYLFTRLYMIRRKKLNLRKDDKNRKVDTVAEIIHIIIMYGLQIFLWIGLIQRWQAGIQMELCRRQEISLQQDQSGNTYQTGQL